MNILLCGVFPSSNLGDAALLEVTLDLLRKAQPAAGLTVMCGEPALTAERFGVKTVGHLPTGSALQALKALLAADLVIAGPGGIVEDATGIGIWRGNIPHLFWTVLAAALLGKDVMFYAVGAGPVRSRYGRLLARWMLSLARSVTVRDRGSRRCIRSLGVGKRVRDVSDPAVLLEGGRPAGEDGTARRLRVGVSVRPWLCGDEVPVAERLGAFLDRVIAGHDAEIVFLPFDSVFDPPVIGKVRRTMRFSGRTSVLGVSGGSAGALEALGTLDILIGMRLHALILGAAVLGKPVLALEYEAKVRFFMESMGQGDRVLRVEEFSPERAAEVFAALAADRAAAAARGAAGGRRLRRKAETGRRLLREFVSREGATPCRS